MCVCQQAASCSVPRLKALSPAHSTLPFLSDDMKSSWTLPVISLFDILHAVSFNHSGLRWLLAWQRAVRSSAQHWNVCTDWITTYFTFWNYATHWIFVLKMLIFSLCNCAAAVNLKHLFGTDCSHVTKWIHAARMETFGKISPSRTWTQVICLPLSWTRRIYVF